MCKEEFTLTWFTKTVDVRAPFSRSARGLKFGYVNISAVSGQKDPNVLYILL